MRAYLTQYVNLLFAGMENCDDIRQEILQNTLDRYDDLISQGKTPEAAYQLAISGIGDINEILGTPSAPTPVEPAVCRDMPETGSKALRAIAVALYILCPIPLLANPGTGGLCALLVIVAIATALMIIGGRKPNITSVTATPEKVSRSSVDSLIRTLGLTLYFITSFATGAWYITWLISPLTACVRGLVRACSDLKEAINHEN